MKWVNYKICLYEWHPWFAWYPVEIKTKKIGNTMYRNKLWLESVYRRSVVGGWEYRLNEKA